MNIAIVGAGRKCSVLLQTLKNHVFQDLAAKVVAVADECDDAICMEQARAEGIFVTTDYNDLFARDDIDLIIELTGRQEIFFDILAKKGRNVRAFDHRTAQLFWELNRISTLQEKTKYELAQAKNLYDIFINELMEEDVMIISPEYQILDINETLSKKMGLERKKVIGRYCYEISHRRDRPCEGEDHPCPLLQSIKTRKSSQTTHIHQDTGGKNLFYSISCYPIFEGEKVVALVEMGRDITRDINMQKMIAQQEKLASIGQLAAGVAHEINNPMTSILTTAMLLQEDMETADPNYKELQIIVDETLRCRKIVNSLLSFARQAKPEKRASDINEIIRDAATLTRKQAAFKDVVLEQDLAPGMPLVLVDKDQMQQALINLVLNAIEATEGGGKVTLESRWDEAARVIKVSVCDTGKGIPEENLDRIFEPFFTTKDTGTGLGMAITHGLVERNGGTITVRSKLSEGTTFQINLPLPDKEKDVS